MRQWAHLKPDSQSAYRKIMLYASQDGVYVFLYDAPEAVFCTEDEFYETMEDALSAWEDQVGSEGWHVIEDPLPGCQQDSIEPIRVKGMDTGLPRWGQYEILVDGIWSEFRP